MAHLNLDVQYLSTADDSSLGGLLGITARGLIPTEETMEDFAADNNVHTIPDCAHGQARLRQLAQPRILVPHREPTLARAAPVPERRRFPDAVKGISLGPRRRALIGQRRVPGAESPSLGLHLCSQPASLPAPPHWPGDRHDGWCAAGWVRAREEAGKMWLGPGDKRHSPTLLWKRRHSAPRSL
eukprot:scaffold2045_cov404-Prasinococcus_capsulatus_cf.AAC.64